MLITERLCRRAELTAEACGFVRDTVTLAWDDRSSVHGRRRTDGGIEFGTLLPRGTVLREGDCLIFDTARLVVTVVERPEPVFVIEPRTPQEWALFAYQIGNRHQPMMITDRGIVCPDEPGVEPILQRYRMPYTRQVLPFTPGATVASHQHSKP